MIPHQIVQPAQLIYLDPVGDRNAPERLSTLHDVDHATSA